MKINEWPRHGIQALWAFLTNSRVSGFVTGKIYIGKLKHACVPGLNCYSCPGATGACPIGSLQAVIGSWNFKMAYYVVGFLIFVGALFGRLVCGFLCPFGLIQDLLNKIPFPKKIRTDGCLSTVPTVPGFHAVATRLSLIFYYPIPIHSIQILIAFVKTTSTSPR